MSSNFPGRPPLNRDTTVCISLSGRPSNHGIKFHNYLYEKYGLDYLYKAMTTKNIDQAIAGVRALGIRGCSISMPFKEDVLALVDEVDHSAQVIGAVNTIVNSDGYLKAYNTDVIAVASLLASYGVDPKLPFVIKGSGGMARAVAGAFYDAGFHQGTILARHAQNGQKLAQQYGYTWSQDEASLSAPQVLVNVTPLGMADGPEEHSLAFSEASIAAASLIFDVVAMPVETPLIQAARSLGKKVITGGEVAALQAAEQFKLYTGRQVAAADVAEAEAQAYD